MRILLLSCSIGADDSAIDYNSVNSYQQIVTFGHRTFIKQKTFVSLTFFSIFYCTLFTKKKSFTYRNHNHKNVIYALFIVYILNIFIIVF